jgi:hypothetical protein
VVIGEFDGRGGWPAMLLVRVGQPCSVIPVPRHPSSFNPRIAPIQMGIANAKNRRADTSDSLP